MTTARKPKRARQLGVSDDQYERLLAAQGGGCAICGNTTKTRRLHVDHDHKTGAVRGLLCYRCNRFLHAWMTSAWLQAASAYVYFAGHVWDLSRSLGTHTVLDEINRVGKDGKS